MAHYAREGASFFAGYPRGSPRVAAASTLTRAAQLENRVHLLFLVEQRLGKFNDYRDESARVFEISKYIYVYICYFSTCLRNNWRINVNLRDA